MNNNYSTESVGYNKLFISKVQRLHPWSLGVDKWFYLALDCVYDDLLKLIHIS